MGKKIASVKDAFKEKEQKDQWISFDNEDEGHFYGRMQRGGSDPSHFSIMDMGETSPKRKEPETEIENGDSNG